MAKMFKHFMPIICLPVIMIALSTQTQAADIAEYTAKQIKAVYDSDDSVSNVEITDVTSENGFFSPMIGSENEKIFTWNADFTNPLRINTIAYSGNLCRMCLDGVKGNTVTLAVYSSSADDIYSIQHRLKFNKNAMTLENIVPHFFYNSNPRMLTTSSRIAVGYETDDGFFSGYMAADGEQGDFKLIITRMKDYAPMQSEEPYRLFDIVFELNSQYGRTVELQNGECVYINNSLNTEYLSDYKIAVLK